MLTRLIVASYGWLLEVALWATLALAGIAGYNATVPILNALGAHLPEFYGRSWCLWVYCCWILTLGGNHWPLLVLIDIRHAVRSIEAKWQVATGRGRTPDRASSSPFDVGE